MVAPTPFLDVNVDLGELPQDVKDIKNAVGTPAAGTTIAGVLQSISDQIGQVAADACTAATKATDAAGAGQDIKDAIGTPPAGKTISDLMNIHFATKADIRSPKCLIRRHRIAEEVAEYLLSGQVRSPFGLVSHRLQLQDPDRRASLTFADLRREAAFLQMLDSAPEDDEEGEELVRHLKALFEHMPSQPQPPSEAGSRRR